jgi:unsaturated chondroitin disaccharide hydrolase
VISHDLESAFASGIEITKSNLMQLEEFPHTTSSGKWNQSRHGRWTAGFWVGLLWLGYLSSGDSDWKSQADKWSRRLEFRKYDRFTHDMGFLFQPSFIRGYAITGDEYYQDVALCACASHASRYNPIGKFIPAWDVSEDPRFSGRTIVDTVMNLPILYWGAKNGGDVKWADIANNVSATIRKHHVRYDGSTFHVVDFDPQRGMALSYTTHQGYAADSCWSRGQAWAIYGFAQLYGLTRDPANLEVAKRLADYFIRYLPDDGIPYWDFDAPNVPYEPKDSAAAAIAASGLLELDRMLGGASTYANVAREILYALASSYLNIEMKAQEQQGILLKGAVDVPRGSAIDESIIYGDHYFMEALFKLLYPEKWPILLGV